MDSLLKNQVKRNAINTLHRKHRSIIPSVRIKEYGKAIFAGMIFIELCIAACASETLTVAQAKATREKLVADAKTYLGIPYVSGAVGPAAFDCSGFIYFIARESAKVQLPRSAQVMYTRCTKITDDKIEIGDLLFFSASSSGSITHVSLYIGNNQIIHAASDGPKTGVIISSRDERYWKTHYVGAGRFLPSARGTAENLEEDNAAASASADADNKTTVTNNDAGNNGISSGNEASSCNSSSSRAHALNKNSRSAFLSNMQCSFSFASDWFFSNKQFFAPDFRGLSTQADIMFAFGKIYPGIGALIRWNKNVGVVQFPFVLILAITDYVRVYGGIVLTAGLPKAVDSGKTIYAPIFPGTFGTSVNTPPLKLGIISLCLVQDICYTVFRHADGRALSAQDAITAGLVFSSGVRVTLSF
ncbi:MAG: C40 family peptidase [Treponema sp.]|nr:C40 family peptidase [Treponema sp.]